MTAEGGEPDPDLAALAAEFGGWEFSRWDGLLPMIRARRKPAGPFSQWALMDTAEGLREKIRHREQNPPGG